MSDWADLSDAFGVEVARDGEAVVIALRGELDIATAPLLESALEHAAATGADRTVVDLHRLRFMDAAGLSVVLAADRRLASRLVVRSPSIEVRRVLAITGADRRLALEPGPPAGTVAERGEANLAYVRRLWEAFGNGGVVAVADLVPDDVVWRPAWADGDVVIGTRELLERWAASDPAPPRPLEFRALGEDVVVHCEVARPGGGMTQLWSLYRFDGPRLIEAITYRHAPVALSTAAEPCPGA
jgi:anti-sigma B factor antagonist